MCYTCRKRCLLVNLAFFHDNTCSRTGTWTGPLLRLSLFTVTSLKMVSASVLKSSLIHSSSQNRKTVIWAISTSKRRADHPFAGQNTQQTYTVFSRYLKYTIGYFGKLLHWQYMWYSPKCVKMNKIEITIAWKLCSK